jgi:hypothetical protein
MNRSTKIYTHILTHKKLNIYVPIYKCHLFIDFSISQLHTQAIRQNCDSPWSFFFFKEGWWERKGTKQNNFIGLNLPHENSDIDQLYRA